MIFDYQDYRPFLKQALADRAKSRTGYSIRAFSGKLGVANSFLSEVLRGKKSLSMKLAYKIGIKLDLTEAENQYFGLLVQLDQEQDPSFRGELLKRAAAVNGKPNSRDLTDDVFKTISDWYHYAILELTYLPGITINPSVVSRKLGITKLQANAAIKRLIRLGLLEPYEGTYRKIETYILAESHSPNQALKEYHRQLLEKAILSLNTQSPRQRMSSTDVIAIDSKYIGEVDRLSREFSSALVKLANKSKIKDSVYALSVHFFNLTEERDPS